MKKILFLLAFTGSFQPGLFAQPALRVGLIQETSTLPAPARLLDQLNPGVMVGVELFKREQEKFDRFQSLDLGFYYHPQLNTGFFALTNFSLRYKPGKFRLLGEAGPGYQANYTHAPQYLDQKKVSHLRHQLLLNAGLGLEYQFGRVAPFLKYQVLVEMPFLRNNSVFFPHQIIQIGTLLTL